MLPDYVLDALKKHRGFGYVYPGEDGQVMNGDALSKRLKDLLWNNNLPKTTLHPLRPYNATALLKRGVPDKKIANVLDKVVSKRGKNMVSKKVSDS